MRTVTISGEQKFLLDLLMSVQTEGLILQTTAGQQFVLLSMEGWQGFEVGESADFEQEVKATSENQALMAFLARRSRSGQRVSMAKVKQQLGLR